MIKILLFFNLFTRSKLSCIVAFSIFQKGAVRKIIYQFFVVV
jgi:hypothetical protein